MRRRLKRLPLVLALVLAAAPGACGGDDSGGGVTQHDTVDELDVIADTSAGVDSQGGVDTAETGDTLTDTELQQDTSAPADVSDQPLGALCASDAECLSGTCMGAPQGVCVQSCAFDDECSDARACVELPGGQRVCASDDDLAGLPCVSDDTCPGDTVCQALPDGTSRCVYPCTDFNCDVGFECDSDLGVCLPPGGFQCSLFDIASGAVGRCEVTNDFGSCAGEFACAGAGAAVCSARTPAAEVCDGEDNDCDGSLDESTCNDDDPCTVDRCDSDAGVCVFVADPGASCDDGDPCTTDDVCTAEGDCTGTGSCACETPVDCDVPSTLNADCVTVTCEGEPKACVFTPVTDGAGCDDGDACTVGDACLAGACVASPMDCSFLDTPCGDATCAEGTCLPPTNSCSFTVGFHTVSASFAAGPSAAGLHTLQCSVGHTGPTGVDSAPGVHTVHWGFHATRP